MARPRPARRTPALLAVPAVAVLVVTVMPGGPALGAPPPARTTMVDRTDLPRSPEGGAYGGAISGDGRWVAFWAEDALTVEDTNGLADVYLRDLVTGSLTRVPGLGDAPRIGGPPGSYAPAATPVISGNGRIVVYSTQRPQRTDQPVPAEGGTYRYDRVTGRLTHLEPLGIDARPRSLTTDGRYLHLTSPDRDLVTAPPATTDGGHQSYDYVADLLQGTLVRAVARRPGRLPSELEVTMSGDGRTFAVGSPVALDGGRTGGLFLRARSSTVYRRVPGAHHRVQASLTADGRFVAFTSDRALVRGDTNRISDIYRYDSRTKAMSRVSVTTAGRQCTVPQPLGDIGAVQPLQSADGSVVLFESGCQTFSRLYDPSGRLRHLFARDVRRHTLVPVDVTWTGRQAYASGVTDRDGFSLGFRVSGDGSKVVFTSNQGFVRDDAPGPNVYLRAPVR